MGARAASRIRLNAAEGVAQLRREMIALRDRHLTEEARQREEYRIVQEIHRAYDTARAAMAREVEAARESALRTRARSRRLAGAFGDPLRADAMARVAERLSADDLLRLARQAVAADDMAAAHGIYSAALARGASDASVRPVLDALSTPTEEERRCVGDYLLVKHEGAMLDSEEVQAASAEERVDTGLLGRVRAAWLLNFGPDDETSYTEAEVHWAREALGVAWSPARFEVAEAAKV